MNCDMEKAKRQLQHFFDDLEFMFTDTSCVVVLERGKRDMFHGDINTLKTSVDTIYWLHQSTKQHRWYSFVKFADGQYGYIRCSQGNFLSTENTVRFYVSQTYKELIRYAMKDHAYKIYKKRATLKVSTPTE